MSQGELQKQQQLIESLLEPRRYTHPVKKIYLIETHISWVLLAGRFAYKIKKALNLGFLNTLLLATRQHDCGEELRLNRRLAPALYLEVVAIGGSATAPQIGETPAIEYAVKMRRFSTTNTLDRLIQRGQLTGQQMDGLALTLANFHANLPAATNSDKLFSATVAAFLQQNFTQLATLLSGPADLVILNELQLASQHALRSLTRQLDNRYAQGFVRECHGDLHLGNIALIRNLPTPFDGIDFNPALRWIDVIDETAFL